MNGHDALCEGLYRPLERARVASAEPALRQRISNE
jgi:hypothetical protein